MGFIFSNIFILNLYAKFSFLFELLEISEFYRKYCVSK